MRLDRIDKALDDCENHLIATGSFNTPIETLLIYALLIVIYAEFEQMIGVIVQHRIDAAEYDAEREGIRRNVGRVSRIRTSDLRELLDRFETGRGRAFRDRVLSSVSSQRSETYYNNLIENRHRVAHATGSNITFAEVRQFYDEGHLMLDLFEDALLSDVPR